MPNLLYPGWELWEGQGYPSVKSNAIIYYYPNDIDIENESFRNELVKEMHLDGSAPTKAAADTMLDNAVVVHGQVVQVDNELHCWFGPEKDYEITHTATWVEVDEYDEP